MNLHGVFLDHPFIDIEVWDEGFQCFQVRKIQIAQRLFATLGSIVGLRQWEIMGSWKWIVLLVTLKPDHQLSKTPNHLQTPWLSILPTQYLGFWSFHYTMWTCGLPGSDEKEATIQENRRSIYEKLTVCLWPCQHGFLTNVLVTIDCPWLNDSTPTTIRQSVARGSQYSSCVTHTIMRWMMIVVLWI